MKTGDPSIRKYHCSDNASIRKPTSPHQSASSTGSRSPPSGQRSYSSSSGSSMSSTKSSWEGKEIGDCFKSCKASGKKCIRMKTGDPSVRKYHCTGGSDVSSTGSSGSSTRLSQTKPTGASPGKSGSSVSTSTEKTWTRENYKSADPNCNDYCTQKDMRCSFVNLKPITYGCKAKFGSTGSSSSNRSKYEGKTWTIKNYKTADPTCKDYCTEKGKKCSLVVFRPNVLYGCK